MHWGLFCSSSLKWCILVGVMVCFGLMKIRLPSVSLLCTWSDCMAIFVNSFYRVWYWDLFVTQNLWFCWFRKTAALFLFVPFLLKDVSIEMFSNAYKIPFYSLIPSNLCLLWSHLAFWLMSPPPLLSWFCYHWVDIIPQVRAWKKVLLLFSLSSSQRWGWCTS